MNSEKYIYTLEIKVRDYEVDIEGIVNNANYLHYLEYTRHEFIEASGMSFGEMHTQGIDPVVTRIDIRYKTSLTCGDTMKSCLYIKRVGAKYVFYQDIYRSDGVPAVKAVVEAVCIKNGQLTRGDEFMPIFGKFLQE